VRVSKGILTKALLFVLISDSRGRQFLTLFFRNYMSLSGGIYILEVKPMVIEFAQSGLQMLSISARAVFAMKVLWEMTVSLRFCIFHPFSRVADVFESLLDGS
jgi:hypothetical protein